MTDGNWTRTWARALGRIRAVLEGTTDADALGAELEAGRTPFMWHDPGALGSGAAPYQVAADECPECRALIGHAAGCSRLGSGAAPPLDPDPPTLMGVDLAAPGTKDVTVERRIAVDCQFGTKGCNLYGVPHQHWYRDGIVVPPGTDPHKAEAGRDHAREAPE